MRIYSNFHDYYDNVRVWGADPNTVYGRKTADFNASTQEYKDLAESQPINDLVNLLPRTSCGIPRLGIDRALLVFFCGKVYPCIIYGYRGNFLYGNNKTKHCYNFKSIEKFISKYGCKKSVTAFKKDKPSRWFQRRDSSISLKKLFEKSGMQHDIFVNHHHNTGVPVFIVEPGKCRQQLIYNPTLKDIKFYKVFDTYQCFQELSMFIGGIMGGQVPPMIEISDKIRLEKHGFDAKYSFRKEKSP